MKAVQLSPEEHQKHMRVASSNLALAVVTSPKYQEELRTEEFMRKTNVALYIGATILACTGVITFGHALAGWAIHHTSIAAVKHFKK